MTGDVILLLRHGLTDWNVEGRFQGVREIPINAIGRRQAARNGRVLPSLLADHEWKFVASPLGRAMETMQIVLKNAGRADQPFTTDPALREVSFGDWEAHTIRELKEEHPEAVATRKADKWNFVPPAGESYAMLAERFAEWMKGQSGRTVLVAHGGITRVALHHLIGLPAASAPQFYVPHDRIIAVFEGKAMMI
ncbi:histidine phosphatase family protein [Afifella sp. IM 167]|uniref:histidine phosphatase family protein n=1 Tax=Afifella sp. IM 167 TaxID=2033586 RepID=UPI001CCE4375|nr:histidine phosphatase family protein [Afifella sp. IM 167]MBZ8133411.1 histidine phosphatase family protein [Afifella sp. IM 167]